MGNPFSGGGGGGGGSSSSSTADNKTNVEVTTNTTLNNVIDTTPIVEPLQRLTDALSGIQTERAKATAELSTTVKDVADKAAAAMEKAGKNDLLIAALALGAAYYGAKH